MRMNYRDWRKKAMRREVRRAVFSTETQAQSMRELQQGEWSALAYLDYLAKAQAKRETQ
jgi:hypothetical protein